METGEEFRIPSFSFKGIDNKEYRFDNIKKRFNLLVFYDVKSPDSEKTINCMRTLSEFYPNWFLSVIGISENDVDTLKEHLKDKDNRFINVIDEKSNVAKALCLKNVPSLFLIDNSGHILKSCEGLNEEKINGISREIAENLSCDPIEILLDDISK